MMRRTVAGPFSASDLGGGRWHLATRGAAVELFLRGIAPGATEALTDPSISTLEFDWYAAGVRVTVARRHGASRVDADSVIIHEPRPRLYQALPLAGFDPRAQRFWRRVFLLMRLPGGRRLLNVIARRRK
jgi:hypothetical protein